MNPGIDTGKNELIKTLKSLESSMKKSEKANDRLGAIMFILALVQVLIALDQVLISVVYPNNPVAKEILAIAMILSALGLLVYFFHFLKKEMDKKKK